MGIIIMRKKMSEMSGLCIVWELQQEFMEEIRMNNVVCAGR